jgi:hypothetical protein
LWGPKIVFTFAPESTKSEKEMKRIKVCSLDFLMYAQEVRLEEDELMDEGCMEECERLSVADMRRSYAKYLRDLASY